MTTSTARTTPSNGLTYPPEPWDLLATAHLSFWWVNRAELRPLPAGVRPLLPFGRTLVGAAFIVYRPGGVLAYRELAALAVVRSGLRLALTITDIWVDSAASALGGRELWGIPKELAAFDVSENGRFEASARPSASAPAALPVASLRFEPQNPLPALPPLRLYTAQDRRGELKLTRLRLRGRLSTGHATWSFDPTGRLGYLPRESPAISLRIDDAVVRFGS